MKLTIWAAAAATVLTLTACSKSNNTASTSDTTTSGSSSSVVQSTSPSTQGPSAGTTGKADGGLTIGSATDLKKKPEVSGKSDHTPAALEIKDLVVGTGPAASPTSSVTVQYLGFRATDGGEFDSSWNRGQPASFSLMQVVPGFTQGIGGTTGVPPMKVGGRRLMLLPAELGYGAQGAGADIPPNTPIAFIVDLIAVQ